MPVYSFRRLDNDEVIEKYFTIDRLKAAMDTDRCIVLEDGVKAVKDCVEDFKGRKQYSGELITTSVSLGLTHEEDVIPEMERARKHGVYVTFNEDLLPVFTSDRDFRKYQKITGTFNRDDYK